MIFQADEGVPGNPIESIFVVLSGNDHTVETQGARLTFESAERFALEVMAHHTKVLHIINGWLTIPIPQASDIRQEWREKHGERFVRIEEVRIQE